MFDSRLDSDWNRYMTIRLYIHAADEYSSYTSIPACTVIVDGEFSEPPLSYSYNSGGIQFTLDIQDLDNAVIEANWDFVSSNGVDVEGSKIYNLKHEYRKFRYDDMDDFIFDYYF